MPASVLLCMFKFPSIYASFNYETADDGQTLRAHKYKHQKQVNQTDSSSSWNWTSLEVHLQRTRYTLRTQNVNVCNV